MSNVDATQNNMETSQNYPLSYDPSKNDDGANVNIHYSNKMMNNMSSQSSKQVKNPNVMKRPRETDEEILNFFLYQFKCEPCQLKKGMCQDKSTCEGWHHEGERRRNPGNGPNFVYSEEPCPKLKTPGTNKWLKPTNCKDGDLCPYSHTLMEQMYHPNIYKTSLCTNFSASGGDQCQWGYFCTHAHGQKDIRNPNKKNVAKRLPSNTKQKQQKNSNISDTTHGHPLETFKQVVSVFPKLFQKIPPIETTNGDNELPNYSNQQISVSQHSSGNGSPSRSYHTPSYQAANVPLNGMNTPNSKFSPLPPSGPTMTQTSKPPHLLLPASPYGHPQIPTHAMTPNTMTYEHTYYAASQTFPDRLRNERQQQYSWDINSNDISHNITNLQQSAYTPMNNVDRSPPPPMSQQFDAYNASNSNNNNVNMINNIHNVSSNNKNNASPSHSAGSHSYIAQTFTPTASTITSSPSQRPMQLPRPRSMNVVPSNSKLQVLIPSNQGNFNQIAHQMTPPSTIGHAPRYMPSTSTYQTYTPQTQPVGVATIGQRVDVNTWPTASQNGLTSSFNSKPLQPIQDIASPGQRSVSSQQTSEIPQTNLNNMTNPNVTNGSTAKESRNDVSFYLFGDDSLMSPTSNRPDGLTNTPPPPRSSVGLIADKQTDERIINQLKAEINALKKELESEKEKTKILQTCQNNLKSAMSNEEKERDDNQNKPETEEPKEKTNLFDKLIICPSCKVRKGTSRNNVLIPCGHLVCGECVPQKGKSCPICLQITSENPQKLNV